jgi:uncharacterized protein YbaP (TraB family)
MKRIFVFIALAAAFTASSVMRVHSQKAAPAAADALLYEITGPGIKEPSYLFGTIHIICSKDMFPAERFDPYFNKTRQLVLEFDMDDQAVLQTAVTGSMLKDGKGVKDMVTAEDYAKIDAAFKDYLGMSFDPLQRFKPMVASTYLMTSPKVIGCQPPVVYDSHLAQRAGERKMPVLGLETASDQIAVIDSIPLEKQLKDLVKTASDPSKDAMEFQSLYKTYLTQESDELYLLATEGLKTQGYSQEKMLDQRNARWIPLIEREVRSMPTFFAVGSGHLGGKMGVVALLRAKGFKLTPIRF